ncbi:nuclear transport factor 2 family protein [Maribacter sp. PR1]|uniref:Nuclear transport factor 2 family protein n=1 Tax=Maribacter cobaltidurans TaxID=1178778 RepID=A0ABU7IYR7_9FLAO|nr:MULTISPECIES: nuclear transport factor 2 family protein [Maribacter]MDC6390592.1 nuclear transport factor 2 family protein [Maribacter sp. PR1]MEE1977983.1 nuclear transport factor 2 family protein [Maribacter cobaltidurans]
MTDTNKIILQKANEAVSKGNYEEFLQYCTDDTKWIFVGDQILNGKEAVRKWMLNEYIEPPQNEVKHLIAENDYLTAMGQITVMNESGKGIQYSYCDVWKFRDGKMAELMAYVIEHKDLKDDI